MENLLLICHLLYSTLWTLFNFGADFLYDSKNDKSPFAELALPGNCCQLRLWGYPSVMINDICLPIDISLHALKISRYFSKTAFLPPVVCCAMALKHISKLFESLEKAGL